MKVTNGDESLRGIYELRWGIWLIKENMTNLYLLNIKQRNNLYFFLLIKTMQCEG